VVARHAQTQGKDASLLLVIERLKAIHIAFTRTHNHLGLSHAGKQNCVFGGHFFDFLREPYRQDSGAFLERERLGQEPSFLLYE
jgi:hypothetical protein